MYSRFDFNSTSFHRTSGMSVATWEEVTELAGISPALFLKVGNHSGGDIKMRIATSLPTDGPTILDTVTENWTGALPGDNAKVYLYGATAPNDVEFTWA